MFRYSKIPPYYPLWVHVWNWYHFLMLLILQALLLFASFPLRPVIAVVAIRLYIWPQIWHWIKCPPTISCCFLVVPSSDSSQPYLQSIFTNGPYIVLNLVFTSSTCLRITVVDGIFSILSNNYFNFIPFLPSTSQKVRLSSEYDTGVLFYIYLHGTFVLNTSLFDIPSSLI